MHPWFAYPWTTLIALPPTILIVALCWSGLRKADRGEPMRVVYWMGIALVILADLFTNPWA